jgi:hypothetical protein
VLKLLKVARGQMTFPVNEASAKWWANYNLFNILQADSSLQDLEPELKAFSDSVSLTNFGNLYRLNGSINKGNPDLAFASLAANSFHAENNIEQNLKDVYIITIAKSHTNNFNSNEITKLKEIAQLCPYIDGPAVYNARVMLSVIDNTIYSNECETAAGVTTSMAQANTVTASSVMVYPNPASDKLNIAIHLEDQQTGVLKVYDVTGKLELSKTLNENSDVSEISIASLSDGMYIYKIIVNNTTVNSGKLSIIR